MPERIRGLRKVLAVARFEFLSTVTRLGYLVSLIGVPLFIGAVAAFSGVVASQSVARQLGRTQLIGLLDESGLFGRAPLRAESDVDLSQLPAGLRRELTRDPTLSPGASDLRRFNTRTQALEALRSQEIATLLRVPSDWLRTGEVEEIRAARKGVDLAGNADSGTRRLRGWMVRALLDGKVEPAILERAVRPTAKVSRMVLEADGAVVPHDLLREVKPFALPLGFALVILLSIFTGAGYLATGLAEDKQNRALELLLTALTPEQLFWGKLCGLGGAALLQFVLYLGGMAIPGALFAATLGIEPLQLVAGGGYFVLGFLFFGAVLLAVGAFGSSARYAQQLAGAVTFTALVPMLMLPALLESPSGTLARVLTFLPPTAPITGMLRTGAQALPPWELLLSFVSLSLATYLAVRASSKVFRVALLSTGTRPSLSQLWRWLR